MLSIALIALLAADPTAPFVSKEGGFSVLFPEKPKIASRERKGGVIEKILVSESEPYICSVAWWDEQSPPARAPAAEVSEKNGVRVQRTSLCHGRRCYELVSAGPAGEGAKRFAQAFVDSFKLLDAPDAGHP